MILEDSCCYSTACLLIFVHLAPFPPLFRKSLQIPPHHFLPQSRRSIEPPHEAQPIPIHLLGLSQQPFLLYLREQQLQRVRCEVRLEGLFVSIPLRDKNLGPFGPSKAVFIRRRNRLGLDVDGVAEGVGFVKADVLDDRVEEGEELGSNRGK